VGINGSTKLIFSCPNYCKKPSLIALYRRAPKESHHYLHLFSAKLVNTDAKTLAEPPLLTKFRRNLMGSGTGLPKRSSPRKLGIIGGTDAALGQFPHAVYLSIYGPDGVNWQCAGALFAHNLVITAGELFQLLCY
jgi:hypothetical protein